MTISEIRSRHEFLLTNSVYVKTTVYSDISALLDVIDRAKELLDDRQWDRDDSTYPTVNFCMSCTGKCPDHTDDCELKIWLEDVSE